jgi:hypothetical protein
MAIILTNKGTTQVFTMVQDDVYRSCLFVNVDYSKGHAGQATNLTATHYTEKGARRWAAKKLEEHCNA